MVNILVISILIIPWLIIPFNHIPDPTRLIKAAFFDMTMLGIIVMAIKDGLKFEFKNKYLSWLAAWVFLTFAFNWYYPECRGIGFNVGTLDSMIHFTLSIMATILVCSSFERVDFIRCAKAMCIAATLISIFCIFQGLGLDPMRSIATYGPKEPRHIAALLDNPDSVGNYICMILPLFVYFNRPKYYLCLALCLIALGLTQSSISIVAAFFGLFTFLLLKHASSKKIVTALIATVILFMTFCATNHSFNKLDTGFTGRTSAWKEIFHRANNHLFGQGLGAVKSLSVNFGNNFWMYAHNDYLETYISLGAFGLFLLILLIVHTFKRFNYKFENKVGFAFFGSFVAFLIIMGGSFPMETPPVVLNGLIAYWAMTKT